MTTSPRSVHSARRRSLRSTPRSHGATSAWGEDSSSSARTAERSWASELSGTHSPADYIDLDRLLTNRVRPHTAGVVAVAPQSPPTVCLRAMSDKTSSFRYLKYVGWAIVLGLAIWVLSIIAGLGSWWVPLGVVAFVGFIVLVNRLTRRPSPRTGQQSPEHRVVSTDQDRWGGGAGI